MYELSLQNICELILLEKKKSITKYISTSPVTQTILIFRYFISASIIPILCLTKSIESYFLICIYFIFFNKNVVTLLYGCINMH